MDLRRFVLDSSGGPLRRFIVARWLRGKNLSEIVKLIRKSMPKDIVAQQERVSRAEGLAE